jgi:hypothetical protein
MAPKAPKSKRGGKRVGAGRPPTRRAVAETALDVVMRRRFEGGKEPLQVMLDAMDDVLASNGAVAAFPFAQACAPFMHAKLGALAVAATATVTIDQDDAARAEALVQRLERRAATGTSR